ncbi:MAG: hypothetical protein ACRETY_05705 [Steroidobacteraceae bacterium]
MTSQAAFGPPFFRNEGDAPLHISPYMKGRVPFVAAALLAGCATERAYEGPRLPAEERAIVRADPVVSAGLPVQVRIRKADGRDIGLSASNVELPPGRHTLVVDCLVAETDALRRFTLETELAAGGRYRLVANATARNCEAVELIAD